MANRQDALIYNRVTRKLLILSEGKRRTKHIPMTEKAVSKPPIAKQQIKRKWHFNTFNFDTLSRSIVTLKDTEHTNKTSNLSASNNTKACHSLPAITLQHRLLSNSLQTNVQTMEWIRFIHTVQRSENLF